ncbi:MAG TPA: DUF4870 domain-containing protein [Flavitalea sp.]|nr:DUF4870 domain-containing protein [Flavitalea sp.]
MDQQPNSFLGTDEAPIYTPTSDERMMAILSHILCLIVWLFAPLVIYLVKKDESKFVAAHAKESLNFQITIMIVAIILIVTVIGILLLWVLGIVSTVLIIIATIKASENKIYRYPFTIRLIK